MKKFISISICIILLPLSLIAQESKWFASSASSYVGLMQTTNNPLTIIMMGGEKPIYQVSEKISLNAWYFAYIDKTVGYTYAGPSLSTQFQDGFASFGVAVGFTSQEYKPIYAFSTFGMYKNIGWFLNTEHNAWPTWHRISLSYSLNKYIAPMICSQAFLGSGPGIKLTYKNASLETVYHFKSGRYFGSTNDGEGLSFNFNINL